MVSFTITQLLAALLAVELVIMVPINGVFVRLRAQYNPKGLRLHPERGVQPHTGPIITSFFALLVRIYRIEVRFATLLWYSCTIKPITLETPTGMARIVQRVQYV